MRKIIKEVLGLKYWISSYEDYDKIKRIIKKYVYDTVYDRNYQALSLGELTMNQLDRIKQALDVNNIDYQIYQE